MKHIDTSIAPLEHYLLTLSVDIPEELDDCHGKL